MIQNKFNDYPFQYFPNYYLENNLIEEIKNSITFNQDKVLIGEENIERIELRKTCWLSDNEKLNFSYSGKTMKPKKIPELIKKIKNLIYKDFGINFDGILVNYYEDGQVGMGYHSDPVNTEWENQFIILSLGADRKFIFREKENKNNKIEYLFENGDLIYMYGDCQTKYEHSILKNKSNLERIRLVFKKSNN